MSYKFERSELNLDADLDFLKDEALKIPDDIDIYDLITKCVVSEDFFSVENSKKARTMRLNLLDILKEEENINFEISGIEFYINDDNVVKFKFNFSDDSLLKSTLYVTSLIFALFYSIPTFDSKGKTMFNTTNFTALKTNLIGKNDITIDSRFSSVELVTILFTNTKMFRTHTKQEDRDGNLKLVTRQRKKRYGSLYKQVRDVLSSIYDKNEHENFKLLLEIKTNDITKFISGLDVKIFDNSSEYTSDVTPTCLINFLNMLGKNEKESKKESKKESEKENEKESEKESEKGSEKESEKESEKDKYKKLENITFTKNDIIQCLEEKTLSSKMIKRFVSVYGIERTLVLLHNPARKKYF